MAMATGKFVAYYRVSTAEQGRSGLGLDAQREAVRAYLDGGRWRLIGEYTEVESGKVRSRPELAEALERCRLTGATPVIARLDRLGRNLAFLAQLMDSEDVPFVAVDNPHATRFTLHILAAVAEHEAALISARTKAALAAAKARGTRLGGWRPTRADGSARKPPAPIEEAQAAAKARADAHVARVLPSVLALRAEGKSLNAIAKELAATHVATLNGGKWTADRVASVLRRRA